MEKLRPELRVGAHVLVQLGSELVTDVEQAILECVKNAYDADSPGCKIEINTRENGVRVESAPAGLLTKFTKAAETVTVTLLDAQGAPLPREVAYDSTIQRHLDYLGRITIEDHGDGLTPAQLEDSWLVISQSSKRSRDGEKKGKTRRGRTPLGDKGLGRLGSMKLGDILLVESSTDASGPLATAQFRWADCESARTVDEIPVFTEILPNPSQFKGTKVSVMGLRDISDWRREGRVFELARSLARLVSPFEVTSTFPVSISLDGAEASLVSITQDMLSRAIAEFSFEWKRDEHTGEPYIEATARFRKKLFMSRQSESLKSRTAAVFDIDGGKAFAEAITSNDNKQLSGFRDRTVELNGAWFIELRKKVWWRSLVPDAGAAIEEPGPFSGAFYYFHLNKSEADTNDAAAGLALNPKDIKDMSGISILRDGFRIRSQGDWLELSSGMTSGSTYNLRPENTIGYFALSGEQNYRLIEKSDREGFVDNAAYRGFLSVARGCKAFANETLESVRRALDDYHKKHIAPPGTKVGDTTSAALDAVEKGLRTASEAHAIAGTASSLQATIKEVEKDLKNGPTTASVQKALRIADQAIKAMEDVRDKLESNNLPELNLRKVRNDIEDQSEQSTRLLESAAVGLSARGLAHEIRTHLTDIRQRTSTIEKALSAGSIRPQQIVPDLRAIRGACTAIASATALIDPMLPRSRTVKETVELKQFISDYIKSREAFLQGVPVTISGSSRTLRANKPRLTQVLENLARNSLYWLRRGDKTGEVKRNKEIAIQLTSYGFIFSDSGPGVDIEYEETLFDIFVSAKPARDTGQGLGLYITKELLEADGCAIELLPERNPEGRRYKFAVNLAKLIKA